MREIKKPNFVKNKKLVKTTMLALFITVFLIVSSVNAVTLVRETNNIGKSSEEVKTVVLPARKMNAPSYSLEQYNQPTPSPMFSGARAEVYLEEGFEGGVIPTGWLNIDSDGDTYVWSIVASPSWPPHSGTYSAMSASWDSVPLTPDNWLITTAIDLTTTTMDVVTMDYWVAAQDPDWAGEHIEVWISTTDTSIVNFTDQVDDYTCPLDTDQWFMRTVDLSDYLDEIIYIAFRHCESTDWFQIKIDDISVYGSSDDVGVLSIDEPVSGIVTGAYTPKATVKNFGADDLTDVPVQFQIGTAILGPGSTTYTFEANDGGFKNTGTNLWEWGTPTLSTGPSSAYSGVKVWGTDLDANYVAGLYLLETPWVMVNQTLEFWHWYDTEASYDGGNVVMSTDGATWTVITPIGGYTGTANSANPIGPGEPIFTGHNQKYWENEVFDLSAYSGQIVKFRFDFGADPSVFYPGWYIDDVKVGNYILNLEYNHTELVDIGAGQSVQVSFPIWIPSAWHNQQHTTISYGNKVQTSLSTDTNPANDVLENFVALEFGYFHDMAVTAINEPNSGTAATLPVEVEIKNIGQYPESFFDVNVNIKKEYPPDEFWGPEGFESYQKRIEIFPPTGWTNITTNPASTWYQYTLGTIKTVRCAETGSSGVAQDEWFISKTFDCSAMATVMIQYWQYCYISETTPSVTYIEVLGSDDDGVNWNYLIKNYTASQTNYSTSKFVISSWAAGQNDVKIAFRFVSTADTSLSSYFYFDDFALGDTGIIEQNFDGTWGTYGNNPPPGWTILDYGSESPPTWNSNDWYRYSKWGGYGARCYYSPLENCDDWLITPTIDCLLLTGTALRFRHYYYYSGNQTGTIEGSIDNGLTWTKLIASYTTVTDGYSSSYGQFRDFDISSWADGQSQVKIRFRYTGYNGWYWEVDDVWVGSGSYHTTFEDYIPESGFPPVGWNQIIYGTDPENMWSGAPDGTATNPSGVTPHSGEDMAEYDSYYISSANSSLLYTPAINFNPYNGNIIKLHFWMYHDTGYTTSADKVDIYASTDGSNFNFIESFPRYDGTTGWAEHVVDLSSYGSSSTVYIGFMGVAALGNSCYIDDVSVRAYVTLSEYSDTITIIADDWIVPGEIVTLNFDDWTPDDLSTPQNADISYFVHATCSLSDGDSANNYIVNYITLNYFRNVGVKQITSPADGSRGTWLKYTNEVYANALGSTTGTMICAIRLTPTELAGHNGEKVTKVKFYHYDDAAGYTHDGTVRIYDQGTATAPGPQIASQAFTGASGAQWIEIPISGPTIDETKDIWIGIDIPHSTAPQHHPQGLSSGGVTGKSFWFSSNGGTTWVDLTSSYAYDNMIEAYVEVGGGPPTVDLYLKPGSQTISAIVNNLGTFTETGLTCYATIWDYFTDPNGTINWTDDVSGITLDVGGEEPVNFVSYNFQDEGVYKLDIELPLFDDIQPGNNLKSLGIGIDGTLPTSTHTLTPASPDGLNGWYVSNVKVKLEAEDPESNGISSGLDEIKYMIDGGSVQTYTGEITVSSDGSHTVEYWAIDNVGNEETPHNTVTFKIDKAVPEIALQYEVTGGNEWTGWELTFTAIASDVTSGMDRVEFYYNDVLQSTVNGSGPSYVWVLENYNPVLIVTIKTTGYDMAGNSKSDEIKNPKPHNSQDMNSNTQTIPRTIQKINLGR